MPVTGSLEQIRAKVRRITGRYSVNQLSDADLDDYINDFYVYEMPQHLKLFNLKNIESPLFPTTPTGDIVLTPGNPLYLIDVNKFQGISPPFYVGGYEIMYFQDAQSFFRFFPMWQTKETLATGTAIAGPYAGNITGTPIWNESVFISATDVGGNTVTARCNAAGTITGDVVAGGTINLATGAVAGLTFTSVIPAGNAITVQYLIYQEGRPLAVLHYNKVLAFYPFPDVAYEVGCALYYSPDELGAGDQPEIRQWWNFIAMGAALKIFTDNLDQDSYIKLRPIFDEQMRLVERRTLVQLSTQRVVTIYSEQLSWPYQNFGYPYS